jgi:hypothetical protein
MTALLADRFADAQSPVIDLDGDRVFAVYEFDRLPEHLIVRFITAKDLPVQGILLKIRGGLLEANGTEASDLLLWRDTAPKEVEIRVARKGAKSSLKVWNTWRVGRDVTQAWLGNAGMRVEASERQVRLRCSDGVGPVCFGDLEVVILLG